LEAEKAHEEILLVDVGLGISESMALPEMQLPCQMSYGSNFGIFDSGGGKL